MKSDETEGITGYPVAALDIGTSIERITGWIEGGERRRWLVCANPYSLELARKDAEFHEAFHKADLVAPNGAGIILASRILGGNIRERVTGSDIFAGLCRMLDRLGGHSCFFLGAMEETLNRVVKNMRKDFPRIAVAGSYAPPFKAAFDYEDNNRMIEAVNAARPDVLWVGMTAPKQEKWVL